MLLKGLLGCHTVVSLERLVVIIPVKDEFNLFRCSQALASRKHVHIQAAIHLARNLQAGDVL